MKGYTKKVFMLFFSMVMVLFLTTGCEMQDTGSVIADDTIDTFDAAVTPPTSTGSFTKCTYTANLTDSGYSAAMMIYPCQTTQAKYPATTLTGGFTNVYTDMAWLYDHLVTHGYIIIAMTPNNNLGNNPEWTTAHKAGIAKLKSENARAASPIYGRVNTSKLQIMGFSKGGGGTLLASADLGSAIASTQAMAPYMDFTYNLSGIKSPTVCYTGTLDTVALASLVKIMFNSLPTTIKRTYANFNGFTHFDWYGNTSTTTTRNKQKTYITSWMKVYLDGNTGYASYINGSQLLWFYEFSAK